MDARIYILPIDVAEKKTPYLGMVELGEEEQVRDSENIRYVLREGLFLLNETQETHIQDTIYAVKQYLKTSSITNVLQIRFLESWPVQIEDVNHEKYSSTRVDIEIIYTDDLI
jgi:hypothetical protein